MPLLPGRRGLRCEHGQHLRVEAVDQRTLTRARVISKRFGGFHYDLVGLGANR